MTTPLDIEVSSNNKLTFVDELVKSQSLNTEGNNNFFEFTKKLETKQKENQVLDLKLNHLKDKEKSVLTFYDQVVKNITNKIKEANEYLAVLSFTKNLKTLERPKSVSHIRKSYSTNLVGSKINNNDNGTYFTELPHNDFQKKLQQKTRNPYPLSSRRSSNEFSN